jgi:hypothetical protein
MCGRIGLDTAGDVPPGTAAPRLCKLCIRALAAERRQAAAPAKRPAPGRRPLSELYPAEVRLILELLDLPRTLPVLGVAVENSPHARRLVHALSREGLVQWCPEAGRPRGVGVWRITAAGRMKLAAVKEV